METISEADKVAVTYLFHRHFMRITERIYEKYYQNTGYSFWLLALQIHEFGKLCEKVGLETIDLQERAITALYRPHLNDLPALISQYVFSILRNAEADPEGRVIAIEKMAQNMSR